jgi:AcrR family transcriptional regulator
MNITIQIFTIFSLIKIQYQLSKKGLYIMAGGFTEKERVEIRQRLLDSGYELSTEIGIKKMTIAMIAKNSEVAVGTFYNFFASKEEYVVAMIRDTEVKYEKEMASHFSKDGTIALKKFLEVFRENFKPENNFLLRIKLDDWVWLKSHISDSAYLNMANDLKKYEFMFAKIRGIRKDAEPGVVVNFIKSIYALYQNRDTLFEESLQTNVDLIFDAIHRYLKEG